MIKNCLTTIIVISLILIYIPMVESSSSKPDLIVKNIVVKEYGHHVPPYQMLYCRVKNIGDGSVDEPIFVTINVYRCIFLFPIRLIEIFEDFEKPVGELSPGETIDIDFAYDFDLPGFGIFQFDIEVNPDKIIDESNFLNNNDIDYVFRFGTWWTYL